MVFIIEEHCEAWGAAAALAALMVNREEASLAGRSLMLDFWREFAYHDAAYKMTRKVNNPVECTRAHRRKS